ncbi:preprotein translocase subunit SecE [Raineyella sp. W15-4]|uniref:preprotein translocase subunit SecE n=1 Tax=Raineyella sp. W15-4 TaxID=3081651 RepID=UPI002954A144|nr:preprotein translocase subunit SecE [Raineyella sp. W15-4]WOQ17710.1 preprotein translocase subunit SecE [Raineyella sp. W15-4]
MAEDLTDPQDSEDVAAAEERTPASRADGPGGRRPVRRSHDSSRRSALPPYEQKSGPIAFIGQSVDELKKVTWPTRQEMGGSFIAVLLFVAFIMVFVSLLDTGLGWVVLKVFGG